MLGTYRAAGSGAITYNPISKTHFMPAHSFECIESSYVDQNTTMVFHGGALAFGMDLRDLCALSRLSTSFRFGIVVFSQRTMKSAGVLSSVLPGILQKRVLQCLL